VQRASKASWLLAAPAALLLTAPQAGQAAYSNDPNAPTVISGFPTVTISDTLPGGGTNSGGVNSLSQYVSFTVPTGFVVRDLSLTKYGSTDDRAFVALMPGSTWTAIPNTTTGSLPGAIAFHHPGTGAPNGSPNGALCSQQYLNRVPTGSENCVNNPVGQSNLLTKSLIAPVNILQAGTYSMWIQQTAAPSIFYEFQAQFTPVPAPLPALGAAAGLGLSRRLRKRIKDSVAAA
jgi:hypothetical protein